MWPACSYSMNGENRLLVTDQLVEFENQPIEVHEIMKITDHFRGIYSKLTSKNWKMSTCNRSNLEALEYLPIMPKNIPRHYSYSQRCYTNVLFLSFLFLWLPNCVKMPFTMPISWLTLTSSFLCSSIETCSFFCLVCMSSLVATRDWNDEIGGLD